MLVLREVLKVCVHQVEWEVVYIQTLGKIIAGNATTFVLNKLMELIVPEKFLEVIPEIKVIFA